VAPFLSFVDEARKIHNDFGMFGAAIDVCKGLLSIMCVSKHNRIRIFWVNSIEICGCFLFWNLKTHFSKQRILRLVNIEMFYRSNLSTDWVQTTGKQRGREPINSAVSNSEENISDLCLGFTDRICCTYITDKPYVCHEESCSETEYFVYFRLMGVAGKGVCESWTIHWKNRRTSFRS